MAIKSRRVSLAMVVSTPNSEFSLSFEGDQSVRIYEKGEYKLQIFDTEVQALFEAIGEGFSIMATGMIPQVHQLIMPDDNPKEPPSSPEVEKGPSIDPNHHDDPNWVYLARHEYKDLYFSAKDMMEDARSYTGTRDEAHAFPTRYAALRFTQGIKHPVHIMEAPAAHVVSWRLTENGVRHWFDGSDAGTLHFLKAKKMHISEASTIAQSLPDSWIISVVKVVK